jgi:LysR family glycine cleavage system transcriptional activator
MLNLNLNWLRTFEAVARLSGFTAASQELGLTQTAVSLQIKALETKLGNDLFIRRAKSIQLTEIGKAYLPSVRNTLETLTISTYGLFGPDLRNTIVVRASMALIIWLAPKLGEFKMLHPEIGLKFVTAIWKENVDTQNIDIDIILAPNTHTIANLEKLADEFIVPICSLKTKENIHSIADLEKINPIHILGFDDHWTRYMAEFDLKHEVKSTRLIVDTSVAACELVANDLGRAVVIERFALRALGSGQNISIVGDRVPLGQSHYLVKKDVRKEKQTTVLIFNEWLHAQFH